MSHAEPNPPIILPPVTFWICSNCDYIVIGNHAKACEHLKQSPNWSHKLYEFTAPNAPKSGFPYNPTGRSTHSSDSDPEVYYINIDEPHNAYEAIARLRVTNPLVAKVFSKN